MARWLLPENLSDVLPAEARRMESARRTLLDLYATHGFELVVPPIMEHLDSLLTGTGHDLDLRTFKLIDQSSGRTLGLRADITPQVARIDAHILARRGVTRLCYAGAVAHARPQHPLATREPFQVGAELYGDAGLEADREVLELAVASLRLLATAPICLDLGHTGVLRALLLGVDPELQDAVIAALHAKDYPTLEGVLAHLEAGKAQALRALSRLHGDRSTIARARAALPGIPAVSRALEDLTQLAATARADEISIDLSDLHGYRYHTGITFAAFLPQLPSPALRGGRYDDIGAAFGRARPATGFSILDLRELVRVAPPEPARPAIRAPRVRDPDLEPLIAQLRAAGEVVIRSDAQDIVGWQVDRECSVAGGRWQVVPLSGA
jgi:ATP phosphoribosyltransferase regulatory subunit